MVIVPACSRERLNADRNSLEDVSGSQPKWHQVCVGHPRLPCGRASQVLASLHAAEVKPLRA